jgi:cytidylate kinase
VSPDSRSEAPAGNGNFLGRAVRTAASGFTDDGDEDVHVSRDELIRPVSTGFDGVVALDGPSGTGKSTVARQLAIRLGARYLDTGAMYRAATVAVLDSGVDLTDAAAITAVVDAASIDITADPADVRVTLDGRSIDTESRSGEVTAAVSAVSAIGAVRTQLVAHQRAIIDGGAIVVEGRDIGTVVWPAASPKVYLTADPVERARRRAKELGEDNVDEVALKLGRRDRFDSGREVSPLTQAADAAVLDTTTLSIDEVVDQLVDMCLAAVANT